MNFKGYIRNNNRTLDNSAHEQQRGDIVFTCIYIVLYHKGFQNSETIILTGHKLNGRLHC